jgi:hypothetical protein
MHQNANLRDIKNRPIKLIFWREGLSRQGELNKAGYNLQVAFEETASLSHTYSQGGKYSSYNKKSLVDVEAAIRVWIH